jgi:mono/diheme cytochrome c family protein
MGVGVLVAFWLVAGLSVVLIAMAATRGRRGADDASRTSTRNTVIGVAAGFLLLAVAVPAAVMIANADADNEARGGVDLTAAQVEGRQLSVENCSTCHGLAASSAVGATGPDLDRMRPSEELVLNAIEEGRARGMGQMPADLVTGADAEAVASYVAAVAGR